MSTRPRAQPWFSVSLEQRIAWATVTHRCEHGALSWVRPCVDCWEEAYELAVRNILRSNAEFAALADDVGPTYGGYRVTTRTSLPPVRWQK